MSDLYEIFIDLLRHFYSFRVSLKLLSKLLTRLLTIMRLSRIMATVTVL